MTALGPRTRGSRAAAPGRGTIPFCECANTTPTEPSCGVGGGAGGRPRVHSGKPRGRCSGPRGQRDPAEAWGQGVCCSACRTASSGVPVASPLSAGCWGAGAPSPLPIPPPPRPPTPRPPGPHFSPAATALARAGPRMGSSFRACPLPSSPTLVLRVLCLAQPRPKRRPRRAALEQPRTLFWGEGQAAALGPCPGRKGRVSQASSDDAVLGKEGELDKQAALRFRAGDRKWAAQLRPAPTRAPVGPASHSTDATCHCLEPIYFVFI